MENCQYFDMCELQHKVSDSRDCNVINTYGAAIADSFEVIIKAEGNKNSRKNTIY